MKKLTALLLFTIFTFSIISQNIRSIPTLYGVYSSDSLNAWVVGEKGTILNTKNGGLSWLDRSVDTNLAFYKIDFSSGTNGIIAGDSGLVLRTSDGGINWTKVEVGYSPWISQMEFTDEMNGWICAVESSAEPFFEIYCTKDGGQTWNLRSQIRGIDKIFFLDTLNGWGSITDYDDTTYYARSYILKTQNSGMTWDTIYQIYDEFPLTITFRDSLTGVLCWHGLGTWGGTITTTDGGYTWDRSSSY